jgi:NitT/TauT family transport system ATP-binding protein
MGGRLHPSLGYIFQKDTLLPWYSVQKNIELGLRFKSYPEERIGPRVRELLELGHLSGFAQAYPHQLSGGMRRRVALLMSLAVEPRIVLMDEPFGALDTHTKTHLHRELMDIWRKLGQTILLVTHDLDEAITLSNRVIVLSSPPSKILLDERIDIAHPRDVFSLRETPQFVQHFQSIWGVLGQQFRAAA